METNSAENIENSSKNTVINKKNEEINPDHTGNGKKKKLRKFNKKYGRQQTK